MIADSLGTLYVADQRNYQVMRWWNGDIQERVIVRGNDRSAQQNSCVFLRIYHSSNKIIPLSPIYTIIESNNLISNEIYVERRELYYSVFIEELLFSNYIRHAWRY